MGQSEILNKLGGAHNKSDTLDKCVEISDNAHMYKTTVLIFFTLTLSISLSAQAQSMKESSMKKHSYIPSEGYVSNAETAEKIAEAIWLQIYGKDILKKKPFKAKLENEIWTVEGSLPEGQVGGVPVIEISKKTGEIHRVSHGK